MNNPSDDTRSTLKNPRGDQVSVMGGTSVYGEDLMAGKSAVNKFLL